PLPDRKTNLEVGMSRALVVLANVVPPVFAMRIVGSKITSFIVPLKVSGVLPAIVKLVASLMFPTLMLTWLPIAQPAPPLAVGPPTPMIVPFWVELFNVIAPPVPRALLAPIASVPPDITLITAALAKLLLEKMAVAPLRIFVAPV